MIQYFTCLLFISTGSKSSGSSKETFDGSKGHLDMTNTAKPDTIGESNDGTCQGYPNKMTSPPQIMTSSTVAFTTAISTMDQETSSNNREFTSSPIDSHNTLTEPTLISSVKSIASITTLVSTSISYNSFGFSLETSNAMTEDTSSSLPGSSKSDNYALLSSGPQSSHKSIDTSVTDMFTSFAVSEESTFTSVNFDISEGESSPSEETTSIVAGVSISSNSELFFTPSISDDDSGSSQLVSSSDLVVASSTMNVESDISLLSGNSDTITTQASVKTTTSSFNPIGTTETSFKTSVSDSSSQSILSSSNSIWSLSTSESPSKNPETSSFSPNGKTSFETSDSSFQETEASNTLKLSLDVSSNYLSTPTIDVGDASSTSDQESLFPLTSPQISDSYSSENDISASVESLLSDTELTGSVQEETFRHATLSSPVTETIGDNSTIHFSSTDGQSVISVSSSVDTSSDEKLRESSTYNSEPMIAATITSSELQDRTNISDDISDTVSFPNSEQTPFQTEDESINSLITSSLKADGKNSTIGDTTFPSSSEPESEVIAQTTDEYNTTISTLSDFGGSFITLYSSSANVSSSDTENTTADTMAIPPTDDNTVTISFSSDFNSTNVMLFFSSFSTTTDFQSVVLLTTATFGKFETMTLSTATENGSPNVGLSSSTESSNTNETLSPATIPDDDNVTDIFSTVTDEANNSVIFSFSTTENDSTIITTSPDVFVNSTTVMSLLTTIDSNNTDNTFFTTEENASTITVFPSATQINDNDTFTFEATGSFEDNTSMISAMIETHSYNMTVNSEMDDISSNGVLSCMTEISYHSTVMVSYDGGNYTFPPTFDSDNGMMLSTTDEIDNNIIPSTTVTDNKTAIIRPSVISSYNNETINSDSSEDVPSVDYSATDSYADIIVSYTAHHNETDSVALPFTRTVNENNNTTLFPSETDFISNSYSDMVSTETEDNSNSTLMPPPSNYYGYAIITPNATNTEDNITFINSFTTVIGDDNKTFSDFQNETNNTDSPSDSLSYASTMVDSLVDDNTTYDNNTTAGSSSLTYTLHSNYTTLDFLTDTDNNNFEIDPASPIDTQIRNSIESSSPTETDGENNISGSDSDTLTISNIISVVSTKVDTKSRAIFSSHIDGNGSANDFPSST